MWCLAVPAGPVAAIADGTRALQSADILSQYAGAG